MPDASGLVLKRGPQTLSSCGALCLQGPEAGLQWARCPRLQLDSSRKQRQARGSHHKAPRVLTWHVCLFCSPGKRMNTCISTFTAGFGELELQKPGQASPGL